jgi:hypothetical protein
MSQQKKSNTLLYVGVAAAGGVGYYLYTAGGNPKVAEKNFESMWRAWLPTTSLY